MVQSHRAQSVVSDRLLAFILSSPHLHKAILPEGPLTSPYEVLHYKSTLILHDETGNRATFKRKQKIRFLQHGVAAILDHAWGEGFVLAGYRNTAGVLGDSLRDEGVRHLVIELDRPRSRGEELEFQVERDAIGAFTSSDGILETTIDHPIQRLAPSIEFPKSRPVKEAVLSFKEERWPLPIVWLPDGRTRVSFDLKTPEPHVPYVVRWEW